MQEWVSECQKLGIVLKGKEGEEAFAQFTGLPVQRQAEARIPFSQVTFLDGLVQFIVGTNQDTDIPHRTTMYKRIIETCEEALDDLAQCIQVFLAYVL